MQGIVNIIKQFAGAIKKGTQLLIQLIQWWFNKMTNSGSNAKTLMWAVGGLMSICLFCFVPMGICSGSLAGVPTATAVAVESNEEIATQPSDLSAEANSETGKMADNASSESAEEIAVVNNLETGDSAEAAEEESTAVPTDTVEPTAEPTVDPTDTPQPTATPLPTVTPLPAGMALVTDVDNQEVIGEEAYVDYVVDGDTINVTMGGKEYRVRYIGMNTPETDEPFGDDATRANRGLVTGKTVIMVKDVSETDRYGRLLRYVYLPDGTMVNAELVRLGYAQIATYPPDVKHEALFLKLEQEARNSNRGLWGQPVATNTLVPLPTNTAAPVPTATPVPVATATPVPAPQPTEPPPTPAQNCDPSYPDVCIPPYPPDLDCGDIPYRRFRVLQPDPHGFDRDKDGIGCES